MAFEKHTVRYDGFLFQNTALLIEKTVDGVVDLYL